MLAENFCYIMLLAHDPDTVLKTGAEKSSEPLELTR